VSSQFNLEGTTTREYAVCISVDSGIQSVNDFLDFLAWGGEQDTNLFLLLEEHFPPAFYDLKTGFAGEILQKLANYGCRLAIVGSFAAIRSERFRELMREANKGRQVRFAATRDEAVAWLTK
jgi:hypothetical protein